jgi:hypothetical protein
MKAISLFENNKYTEPAISRSLYFTQKVYLSFTVIFFYYYYYYIKEKDMNDIPKTALVAVIPIGLLITTHLKSLPFAYTVRSWFLLRALVKRARQNNLKPDRK